MIAPLGSPLETAGQLAVRTRGTLHAPHQMHRPSPKLSDPCPKQKLPLPWSQHPMSCAYVLGREAWLVLIQQQERTAIMSEQ